MTTLLRPTDLVTLSQLYGSRTQVSPSSHNTHFHSRIGLAPSQRTHPIHGNVLKSVTPYVASSLPPIQSHTRVEDTFTRHPSRETAGVQSQRKSGLFSRAFQLGLTALGGLVLLRWAFHKLRPSSHQTH